MHVLASLLRGRIRYRDFPTALARRASGEALVIPGSYTGTCITVGSLICY